MSKQELSIGQMQHKLARTEMALERVAEKRTQLVGGEYPINPRYDLSQVTGAQRVERVFNRIAAVAHYVEKVTPRLQAYHQKITDKIQVYTQLSITFSRLDEAVKLGLTSQEIADETKRQLLTPLKREATIVAPVIAKEPKRRGRPKRQPATEPLPIARERGKKPKVGLVDLRGQREAAKILLPDGKVIKSVGFIETRILLATFPDIKPAEDFVVWREQLLQSIYHLSFEESKGTREAANLDNALYRVRLMLNENGWTLKTVKMGEKGSRRLGYVPLKVFSDKEGLHTEAISVPGAEVTDLESLEEKTEKTEKVKPLSQQGVSVDIELPDEQTQPVEQESWAPFTARQLAILCSVIHNKNGMFIKYGSKMIEFKVAKDCLGVCREIEDRKVGVSFLGNSAQLSIDERKIQLERTEALEVIRNLADRVTSENTPEYREYLDNLVPQIRDLITQFMFWQDEFGQDVLYAFLASTGQQNALIADKQVADEISYIAPYQTLQRIWDSPYPLPVLPEKKTEPDDVSEAESIDETEHIKQPDTIEPIIEESGIELIETEGVPVLPIESVIIEEAAVQTIPEKLTPVQKVEERFPGLREKIQGYLKRWDESYGNNPNQLIGGNSVTNVFSDLGTVTGREEKIYLQKNRIGKKNKGRVTGKDHHVKYDRASAVHLLCWGFCKRGNNHWDDKTADIVEEIIREEIKKLDLEKQAEIKQK